MTHFTGFDSEADPREPVCGARPGVRDSLTDFMDLVTCSACRHFCLTSVADLLVRRSEGAGAGVAGEKGERQKGRKRGA